MLNVSIKKQIVVSNLILISLHSTLKTVRVLFIYSMLNANFYQNL